MKLINNIIQELKIKFNEKKTVFIYGNFNIVHPGHLRLINFAKTFGDILIIGLSSDDTNGAIVKFEYRAASLLSLDSVNEIIKIEANEITKIISDLRPDVVIKGKEHEILINPEKDIVLNYGGKFIFASGDEIFSSKDLIKKELQKTEASKLQHNYKYINNHKINRNKLHNLISKFQNKHICVIGDIIIDEYIHCVPLGMSQEDPTIVVSPIEKNLFIGGAGIVAGHISSLGAKTTLITVVGEDSTSNIAIDLLKKFKVNNYLIKDITRPTTLKQRFRANNKTLLRVSHLRALDINKEIQNNLLGKFKELLAEIDGVIFSDFNYGCLPQSFVNEAIKLCRKNNKIFFADSQASSQEADCSRFKYADFISATEREARLALRDFRSGIQNVGNSLLIKSKSNNLIIKLGAEGLITLTNDKNIITYEINALNSNPIDVAGAGDAFLSSAALTRIVGGSIWESSYLGSIAAGIQISRLGNTPIDIIQLAKEIDYMNDDEINNKNEELVIK